MSLCGCEGVEGRAHLRRACRQRPLLLVSGRPFAPGRARRSPTAARGHAGPMALPMRTRGGDRRREQSCLVAFPPLETHGSRARAAAGRRVATGSRRHGRRHTRLGHDGFGGEHRRDQRARVEVALAGGVAPAGCRPPAGCGCRRTPCEWPVVTAQEEAASWSASRFARPVTDFARVQSVGARDELPRICRSSPSARPPPTGSSAGSHSSMPARTGRAVLAAVEEPSPRHAQLGVQLDDQRGDVRTQLGGSRAQRVGGLQGVPALHAPLALRAVAHLDVEAPHEGMHRRQVFLVLRRGPARPRRRSPDIVGAGHVCLVSLRRLPAAPLPSVLRPGSPPGTPAASLRPVLGEGSRLSAAGAPRRLELLLQMLATALPGSRSSISFALSPRRSMRRTSRTSSFFTSAQHLHTWIFSGTRGLAHCAGRPPRRARTVRHVDPP